MDKQEIYDRFSECISDFAQLKSVVALRDGFIMTTPFTIAGSLFLLIANLPIPGYTEFMASVFGADWTAPFYAVSGATFSILAFIVVMGVTYRYVAMEGCNANMAAILALSTFIVLMPPSVAGDGGVMVGNVIPKNWVGGNGVITAVFVAFFTGYVYVYCEKHRLKLRMPESVPGSVARAFEALVPAVLLFTVAAAAFGICHYVGATTVPELIFKVIQTPLQGLSDSIGGGSVIVGLQSVLFWAGIHGPNVVGGVANPLLYANSLDNQQILDAGGQLIGNPAAHIFTAQVNDVFVKSGGCGATFGFILASLLVARSTQMKSLTRIALVPGIFNINEPIIFGLPIVFNPYLLIPFTLVPLSSLFVTYFAISTGFMAPMGAMQVPWTTPPIIAGFLLDGWQGAVVQMVNLVLATIIYLPFVKHQDRDLLEEEAQESIVIR